MKHIHIHVHRAATQDSDWDESKHKRAANGQFGAGGGGAKKPAAKSSGGEAPAISTHHSNRGASVPAGAPEKPAAQKYSSKLASLNRLLNNAPSGSEQAKHIQSQIRATQIAQAKATQAAKAAGGNSAPRRDNPYNVSVQLAGRKEQLAELQKDMKTGKYSPEDMAELKSREAQLKRVIKKYEEAAGGNPASLQKSVEQTRQAQMSQAARASLGVQSKEDKLREYETTKAQYSKVQQRLDSPYQTPTQRKALIAERDKLKIRLGRAVAALSPEQKAAKRVP